MKKLLLQIALLTISFGAMSQDIIRNVYDKQSGNTISTSRSFELAVAMGQTEGYSFVNKYGINPETTTGSNPEDLWEQGGTYIYDADNTAPIMYLSSSDNADVNAVTIEGLDIDGIFTRQTITLTGNTNALLTTPLWRVYRMYNTSSTSIAGTCYCHIDAAPTAGVPLAANVRAIINDGNNQTLMSLYTIPSGKVGFLYGGEAGISLSGAPSSVAQFAKINYRTRLFGKVFTVQKSIDCIVGGSSNYIESRKFPTPIPAKTDMRVTVQQVSATMGTWASFEVMLVDEDKFTPATLKAIGQPGYE